MTMTTQTTTTELAELAAKVKAAKDAKAVLRKASAKGQWASRLWELLAAGLLSVHDDAIDGLVFETVDDADWEKVRDTLARLSEDDFAFPSVRRLAASYRKNAAAWDEAFVKLPAVAKFVLLLARGPKNDAERGVVEQALVVLARNAVAGKGRGHDWAANELGEGKDAFARRVAVLLDATAPDAVLDEPVVWHALRFTSWSTLAAFVARTPTRISARPFSRATRRRSTSSRSTRPSRRTRTT